MVKRLEAIVGVKRLNMIVAEKIGGDGSTTDVTDINMAGYFPKPGDEQEFVKVHKVTRINDRNGNGDDVFKATNIKHAQTKKDPHGYKKPKDRDAQFKPDGNPKPVKESWSGKYDSDDDHPKIQKLKKKGFKYRASGNGGWSHHYEHEDGRTATVEYGPSPSTVKSVKIHEDEQLDELSKGTVASYVGKAHDSLADAKSLKLRAQRVRGTDRDTKYHRDQEKWADKQIPKRRKGIALAVKQLAKEDEQLDEISNKTLKSYEKKAFDDMGRLDNLTSPTSPRHYVKKIDAKMQQRNDGIIAANKKRRLNKMGKSKIHEDESLEEVKQQYTTGDVVIAARGPHKGVEHDVVFAHEDGRLNLRPRCDIKENKYKGGMVTAKADHVINPEDLQKEDEQLDELSKDTLRSYISKAAKDSVKASKAYGDAVQDKTAAMNHPKAGQPGPDGARQRREVRYHRDVMDTQSKRMYKRDVGIARASKRLRTEEEQLDEISKKTLGRYVQAAAHSYAQGHVDHTMAYDIDKGGPKADAEYKYTKKQIHKRAVGIKRALNRLTKEDEQLDERSALSPLSRKLKRRKKVSTPGQNSGLAKIVRNEEQQ